jgi:hypothetical protein
MLHGINIKHINVKFDNTTGISEEIYECQRCLKRWTTKFMCWGDPYIVSGKHPMIFCREKCIVYDNNNNNKEN